MGEFSFPLSSHHTEFRLPAREALSLPRQCKVTTWGRFLQENSVVFPIFFARGPAFPARQAVAQTAMARVSTISPVITPQKTVWAGQGTRLESGACNYSVVTFAGVNVQMDQLLKLSRSRSLLSSGIVLPADLAAACLGSGG